MALSGHALPEVTRGFEGEARLLRLFQAGLEDLWPRAPETFWRDPMIGWYLALPSPLRIYEGLELIPDEEVRQERAADAQKAQAGVRAHEAVPQRLLQKAARLCNWPVPPVVSFTARAGRAGVGEALQRAAEDIRAGRVSAAVVGGVDTLLDEGTLSWLAATGRLKTINDPVGLQPGEAAAFLLLETERGAAARGARSWGTFDGVQVGRESRPWSSGRAAMGDGLATALDGADPGSPEAAPWLVVDHCGENYSACELGNVVVRLRASRPGYAQAVLWYPAISFGDTGAAFGAVATCLVLRAFARRYAPGARAVIGGSSEGAARIAFRVGAPPEQREHGRTF
jgi:3-oxoacyl-[acyl-carrier-protein] synthase-1